MAVRGARIGSWWRFDALCLLVPLGLFALNRYLAIPAAQGTAWQPLLTAHLNDLLAGCAFMGYTNLLFDLVRPGRRLSRLAAVLPYMLCCGLFWELAAPLLIKPSVPDGWDVVAYCLGALGYWLLMRAAERRRPKTRDA